ncbi:hypothetical protein BXZ70DRAFT_900462, partial [Cristinia sonorae]
QLAEIRMMKLSWAIREKQDWQEKMKRKEVLAKWKKEAVASQKNEPRDVKLTHNMINYVFKELEAYAKLTDKSSGIQHACNDATFYSYKLLSSELVEALRAGFKRLEDVPEAEKDWHPGSNHQVLDLVHPSLYCLVYGRTLVRDANGTTSLATVDLDKLAIAGDSNFASEKFAWLPSDFYVEDDGQVRLTSSYINNLHKSHVELYDIIPKILSRFIPMFERVLGAIDKTDRPRTHGSFLGNREHYLSSTERDEALFIREYVPLPGRIKTDENGIIPCFWGTLEARSPREAEDGSGDEDDEDEDPAVVRAWALGRSEIALPQAPKTYEGALERDFRIVNLRGRTVQCIVKLANIHLTPKMPKYPGGNWHVEGMMNERIVATGIYYLDSENISESRLEFRTATADPYPHEQDDELCMDILFGQGEETPLIQERGSIATSGGLALAFPNIYQHRVAPFELVDRTKPGHRKILAFFLVEPNERITSTTDVAPQQMEWMEDELHTMTDKTGGVSFGNLPRELQSLVLAETGLMTQQEAKQIRKELMKERSQNVDQFNHRLDSAKFNMCEH